MPSTLPTRTDRLGSTTGPSPGGSGPTLADRFGTVEALREVADAYTSGAETASAATTGSSTG